MNKPKGATHVCNKDGKTTYIKRFNGRWYMMLNKEWVNIHPVAIWACKEYITEIGTKNEH